ncbi:MAG: hypothetical protein SGJ20_05725 [Planctomycetota bacterium]|nr:hypothetical protein [Planctomycetota bacterium]
MLAIIKKRSFWTLGRGKQHHRAEGATIIITISGSEIAFMGSGSMTKSLHGRIDYARAAVAPPAVRLLRVSRTLYDLRELRPWSAVLQLRLPGCRAENNEAGPTGDIRGSGRTGGTPEMPTAFRKPA